MSIALGILLTLLTAIIMGIGFRIGIDIYGAIKSGVTKAIASRT